jgi:PKD repeat protein
MATAYTFDILITGNATNGVDYSSFPTTITIPMGDLTDTVFYSAFIDNNNENTEYFIISLVGECLPCIFSPTNDTIFIKDNYTLNAGISENDTSICTIIPVGYDLHSYIPPEMDQSIISYQWSNNSTNPDISVIPTLGAATTYCLTVTDACGQITVDCITFTISDLTGLNVVSEDLDCFEVCEGTVTGTPINGFAPYTYLVDSITSSSNVINDLCADNYKLFVVDSLGCIDSALFVINQPTLVVPEYSSISASCAGLNDGKAIVTIVGGVPPYEFLWSTGYVFNGIVSDTLNDIGAGNYSITVTDDNGCSQILNGPVEEPEPYVLETSTSTYICLGQTTTMFVEGAGGTTPYFYEWESGFSGGAYSVTPSETTTYWITGHDLNDCRADTSVITIHIWPDISASLATDRDSICFGDEVSIFIDSIWGGTGGPYTVKFSDGVHTDILAPPYFLTPEQTTTYSIVVDDWCGSPQGKASITISVFNEPEIEIFADIYEGCIPLEVNFSELLYEDGREYVWDFGDGYADIGADLSNPKHTYLNEGTFDISVEVSSPVGCKNSRVAQDLITVFQKPEARFTAHPQIVSIIKPIVYFEDDSDVSQGYLTYYWDFDGLNDTLINTQNPEYVFDEIGTYTVQLFVESNKGCKDSVMQEIVVRDEYTFYAPTAISPKSDISKNQTFMPKIIGVDADNFHMLIYDRWGAKIFETFDIYHPWDGKAYGQDVESGSIYPWVIIYKDKNGGDHRKSGTVTVIF